MPLKQILVHMDADERSLERLRIARQLAHAHGAVLDALYAASLVPLAMPYPELGENAASLLQRELQRCAQARAAFERDMRRPDGTATWSELTVFPLIEGFAEQALFADLLVLGQHDPGRQHAPDVPPDFVEGVLAASGRPALVVPYTGQFEALPRCIAIAWKPGREAMRAVIAALPLLQRAERVHVLGWGAEPGPLVQGPRLDLRGWLRLHGVSVQWHREDQEPADLGEVLLSRVCDLSADLLVMGCYGHARVREWVLGGVSRTVLGSMTLPVLMSH
ncbi:universal stress protein [Hydrogenophaga sp. YM1]|jgi:nucleotide-binding universal stress UspA family protein|uniref:universal stress protein n=1 Tax=Hydrogenophaga TaxID=47420 RepID=UPI0008784C0E|nr:MULTISPECIES: universal stress protein [unclassified Hydrogenophaga]MBN9370484.1 universal stress protein [Hydrogenophaga sp.]OJV56265.1 MAG: hypothetical protein BGO22_16780 [Hydrogenophaga sp. 70-12]QRR35433.1 universal stress protein [Hydrogenophaga sp. YM1]